MALDDASLQGNWWIALTISYAVRPKLWIRQPTISPPERLESLDV
jgi:hypothetical protein